MAFLDNKHRVLLATLILATLLAGRLRVRGAAEHKSRRPLEILYKPRSKSDANKDVPRSGRKNNHTVEYVFDTLSR